MIPELTSKNRLDFLRYVWFESKLSKHLGNFYGELDLAFVALTAANEHLGLQGQPPGLGLKVSFVGCLLAVAKSTRPDMRLLDFSPSTTHDAHHACQSPLTPK